MIKEILVDEFDVCYDTNGWFVSVRKTIEGVTAEQAVWKPEGAENSIWGSIAHLTYYNNAYLQRFKGVDHRSDKKDNDATFEAPASPTDEEWASEVAKFDAVMKEWRELINSADAAKFDTSVSPEKPAKWAEVISLMNTHNAYHAGQILLLRKLQGAWDPATGVS